LPPARLTRAALVLGCALLSGAALAQEADSGAESGEAGGAPAAPAAPTTTTTYQTSYSVPGPNSFEDLNSYLPPGDRPSVTGEAEGFTSRADPERPTVISGADNDGNAYVSSGLSLGTDLDGSVRSTRAKPVPEFHMVKKGDTLWAISEGYYENPWEWPRLWSMNPQVANPHWIYPGDQLRTAPSGDAVAAAGDDNSAGGGGFVGRGRVVPAGTVFLRDVGYIGDPERDVWGELVGAREDVMMLGRGDTVYLLLDEDVDVRLGQRLSLFKEVRSPEKVPGARKPPGELVKIFGTVRVDAWDRDTRVARGMIIESLDVIERGARVGPVGRRFDVVPPKKSSVNLEARVLSGVYPNVYYAGNQVVFIDKGKEDGLVPGNRLRAVRHGDTWRRNLKSGSRHTRMRVPLDDHSDAPYEYTPLHGDDDSFPDEVIGVVMVMRTEEYSATCIVLESSREFLAGDKLVAVTGY
jgi:hypothetical protein